jgi:hypothetical protein
VGKVNYISTAFRPRSGALVVEGCSLGLLFQPEAKKDASFMARCHWCQSETIQLINRVPVCVKCADDFDRGDSERWQRRTVSSSIRLREMNPERTARILRAQLAAAEHHRSAAAKRHNDYLGRARPQWDEPENPREEIAPAD